MKRKKYFYCVYISWRTKEKISGKLFFCGWGEEQQKNRKKWGKQTQEKCSEKTNGGKRCIEEKIFWLKNKRR